MLLNSNFIGISIPLLFYFYKSNFFLKKFSRLQFKIKKLWQPSRLKKRVATFADFSYSFCLSFVNIIKLRQNSNVRKKQGKGK